MAPSKLRFTVSQVSGEVRASPLPPGPACVLAAPGDYVQPGQAQGGAITRCVVWGIDPHTGARLTRRRTPTTLHASCRWHPALKRVAGSALGTNHPRPWGLRASAHMNARVPPCVALGGSGAKESWSGSDQRLRPWLQQTRRGRPLADRNLSRREAESRHRVSPNHTTQSTETASIRETDATRHAAWASGCRFAKFPQEMTLQLSTPAMLSQIQILSHEHKVRASQRTPNGASRRANAACYASQTEHAGRLWRERSGRTTNVGRKLSEARGTEV